MKSELLATLLMSGAGGVYYLDCSVFSVLLNKIIIWNLMVVSLLCQDFDNGNRILGRTITTLQIWITVMGNQVSHFVKTRKNLNFNSWRVTIVAPSKKKEKETPTNKKASVRHKHSLHSEYNTFRHSDSQALTLSFEQSTPSDEH